MKHHHLTGSSPLSRAAIDDIIERGKMADWLDVSQALKHDVKTGERTIKMCEARITADPGKLRHVLWFTYLDPHRGVSIQVPGITSGSLDGIETSVTQLIREAALETGTVEVGGTEFTTLTYAETLQVRAAMVLKLNATRLSRVCGSRQAHGSTNHHSRYVLISIRYWPFWAGYFHFALTQLLWS